MSKTAFLCLFLLLAAFAAASADLQRTSLWNDEAWTAWAAHSPNLADTLTRVQADVHPPLYFLLMNGWTRLAGESAYALRLFSTLWGLIGLAGTYAIGKRLFDGWTGLMALVILGTASFFLYYVREARMYGLLLALAVLSTWAYLHWRSRPTLPRMLACGPALAALIYTHYAGALIGLTQAVHLVLTYRQNVSAKARRRQSIKPTSLFLPYLLAVILFAPWIPTLLGQMRANPNGPLAVPVATNLEAVAALLLILTSGGWVWMVAPFLLGRALPQARHHAYALTLVVLWLTLTPITLLALNAWVAPVYQVRYTVAIVPAGALLLAYGLRQVGLPRPLVRRWGVGTRRIVSLQNVVIGLLLAGIISIQWTAYGQLWPKKPEWEQVMQAMMGARKALEPMISDLAPYSPAAYYDRQLQLRQGVSLDLSWRSHSFDEIRKFVRLFENSPSVWVVLPVNKAKTWQIVAWLDMERQVGYRASLVNMIFYRFDQGEGDDLRFRFGGLLRYEDGPGAGQRYRVERGESLCIDLRLTALGTLDGAYSAGLHLVSDEARRMVTQWDAGLGTHSMQERLEVAPCLDIPFDLAPGSYHLELVVYNWMTLERLPMLEDGDGAALSWGDALMLAAVEVRESLAGEPHLMLH